MTRLLCRVACVVLIVIVAGAPAAAWDRQPLRSEAKAGSDAIEPRWDWQEQLHSLHAALVSLPLAAVLGAALALRPRRKGTPPRSAPVIQTQIILAAVGAIVMLIVGASLARAFGIVGAASLVRYRAKIDDPKDAGVMLSTLAVGLASGVGLYAVAVFGTAFVIGVLWIVESFEPQRVKLFTLKVATEAPEGVRPALETLLRRHRVSFELRNASPEALWYEVELPLERRTDRVSNAILELQPEGKIAVEWDEKKSKG
jgi:hypothetical protein